MKYILLLIILGLLLTGCSEDYGHYRADKWNNFCSARNMNYTNPLLVPFEPVCVDDEGEYHHYTSKQYYEIEGSDC